ncbi:bifunctional DNA primase/polymerase [Planctomycetes bacterium K23_9]|uniref:DNA primase/polymerase bifunctional N-terminal domain-containing protein n=1 Tax=Stieleria marina TaxID=1930275 RepID=A0A517NSV8_9BACT|nr:hypothetical protein K239x_21540 [Planctomycetes bacterium K23_9]
MSTTIQHAKRYADFGWSVFPCQAATKKPAVRSWKPFQTTRPSTSQLERWFNNSERNVAVVCGSVSNDLVVRDFDSVARYELWQSNHQSLAKTIPTVRTAGGYHCYCRMTPCPRVRINGVGAGELRGNGGFVIGPPSVHPTGAVYEWIVKPQKLLPQLSLDDLDLGHLEGKLSFGEVLHSQQSQRSQQSKPSQLIQTDVVTKDGDFGSQLRDAINASIPKQPGQRNKCLFDLARRLVGVRDDKLTIDELVGVFDQWYELAEPILRTKDYATSLDDFLRATDNAQTAYGATMAEHLNTAIADGCPAWVSSPKYDRRCKLLAALCRQLQRVAGDQPFYLSTHTPGELFDLKPMQCWRWLDLFVRLGKLTKVETGSLAKRRATRFRYIADDL